MGTVLGASTARGSPGNDKYVRANWPAVDGLETLYAETRHALGRIGGLQLREKSFQVSYRPYAGLRNVIFDRRGSYEVRLSELLRQAPTEVHESLAKILLGKIDRRLRVSLADRRPYLEWARAPQTNVQHEALRRARGYKRMLPPRGHVHDLEALYERLNQLYFEGTLPQVRLGWSVQGSRRLYGHQDPTHQAIVLNQRLDHPRVPELVVASVLHHEMLHLQHGVAYGPGGRRVLHSRAFKRDERTFAQHLEARSFFRDLESGRIRLRPWRKEEPELRTLEPGPAHGGHRVAPRGPPQENR